MNLYLLRHGLAADSDCRVYPDDSLRPLTPRGEEKLRQQARAMEALGLTFEAILYSPFVRTRQTAEIVAREMGLESKLRPVDELAPGGDVTAVIGIAGAELARAVPVLLVGHEPDLSELSSILISGQPDGGIRFKKGGLAHLEVGRVPMSGSCATLRSLLTPAQLLRMI